MRRAALAPALSTASGRLGLGLAALVVAVAFLGPLVAPFAPTAVGARPFLPPDAVHLLGTDMLGRDVLSRLLWGGRTLIVVAVVSTVLAYVVGIPAGLWIGYRGGRADALARAGIDVLIAFPPVVFTLLIVAGFGSDLVVVTLAIAALHAPRVARLVRAVAAQLSTRDFVEAAVLRGESTAAILAREVLPNAWTPVLADFGIRIAGSVVLFASLSFLGFGLKPPAADWGVMVNENRLAIFAQPWAVLAPALMIAALTIGIALLADAVARAAGRGMERAA